MTLSDCTALIAQFLPEPHAGLVSGMLFGVKSTISSDLKDALQATGTIHIVALSGMNITILVRLFFGLFLHFAPRWIATVLTAGVIISFVGFVGPSASVVRAAIMGCISLLAPLTGRISVPLVTWFLASVGMILVRPEWITDVSYQLSVLASLGLIVFGEKQKVLPNMPENNAYFGSHPFRDAFRSWMKKVWLFLKEELVTTLSAQVFTMPILVVVFGRISLIAPIVNVSIGWTVPIITVLGLVMCIVGSVWFPLGRIVSWVVWIFVEYLIRVVLWMGSFPFASVGV